MIEVDISSVWCGISLPDLLAVEKDVAAAHETAAENFRTCKQDLTAVLAAAKSIQETGDLCVLVTGAALSAGIRAVLELLPSREKGTSILFAGDSFSTRQWGEMTRQLEGRNFCILAVSGDALESAVAFRGLRWMMERRCGTEEAAKRIFVVTTEDSRLHQTGTEQGWTTILEEEPQNILGAGGLLPLAIAGVDAEMFARGAAEALEKYSLRSFENPLWLYAGVRNAMWNQGKKVELLAGFEPGFRTMGLWWQQYASGAEAGGLFPVALEYPRDVHGINHRIQTDGSTFFETLVRFQADAVPYSVGYDVADLDGLNYLADKPLSQVQELACQAILESHCDAGIPVLAMDWGRLDAQTFGEIFCFLKLAGSICGHMQEKCGGPAHGWQQSVCPTFGTLP